MSDDAKYQAFVTRAFEAVGLPEVEEDQLEVGPYPLYTNAQIARKLRGRPQIFLLLLVSLSGMDVDPAEKRVILSLAVDMIRQ